MSEVEIILIGFFLGTVLTSIGYCWLHFHRYRVSVQQVERDS
jgi:hypothetical protein